MKPELAFGESKELSVIRSSPGGNSSPTRELSEILGANCCFRGSVVVQL